MINRKAVELISNIDEKLIEQALTIDNREKLDKIKENERKNKRIFYWKRITAVAACFTVILCSVLLIFPKDKQEAGVYIPKIEFKEDVMMDMGQLFVYNKNVYCIADGVNKELADLSINGTLIGDYIGCVTEELSCCTERNEYVDFAGTVKGDVYTVKGYDKDFMLCMPTDNYVQIFINCNGLTLKNGEDLYGEKLLLKNNYTGVEFYVTEHLYLGEINNSLTKNDIKNFVDALYKAPFMDYSDIPLNKGEESIYDRKSIIMFFQMKNGILFELRLYDGGFVVYSGVHGAYAHIEDEIFQKVFDEAIKNTPEVHTSGDNSSL